nr:hypothetical protein [Desulfobacter hydrogenophilus]
MLRLSVRGKPWWLKLGIKGRVSRNLYGIKFLIGFLFIQRLDTRKKSTYLGLNFVREIVLFHGGSIDVKNNPDFGVRAVLFLPAA